ncbi:hypothetical protein HanIR_Chr17g0861521 [Helianthus annuus]|nr:hypothetical protein HanIR_Chr17g0861521 [Helianthus annuus]
MAFISTLHFQLPHHHPHRYHCRYHHHHRQSCFHLLEISIARVHQLPRNHACRYHPSYPIYQFRALPHESSSSKTVYLSLMSQLTHDVEKLLLPTTSTQGNTVSLTIEKQV